MNDVGVNGGVAGVCDGAAGVYGDVAGADDVVVSDGAAGGGVAAFCGDGG